MDVPIRLKRLFGAGLGGILAIMAAVLFFGTVFDGPPPRQMAGPIAVSGMICGWLGGLRFWAWITKED